MSKRKKVKGNDGLITITRDLIFQGRSTRGGWKAKQLNQLGLQWPPSAGWIDRLIGQRISKTRASKFLSLRKPGPPCPWGHWAPWWETHDQIAKDAEGTAHPEDYLNAVAPGTVEWSQ